MFKKIISILIILSFICIGCIKEEEKPVKRRRGTRRTRRTEQVNFNNEIEKLKSEINELKAYNQVLRRKQKQIIKIIDFHSGCIYINVSNIDYHHPGVNTELVENWLPKEKWIKALWNLD